MKRVSDLRLRARHPSEGRGMKYQLFQVMPKVYYALFNDHYDFAMTFLRSCEVTKQGKFRKNPFSVLEYMDWYAKKYGDGAFTYPKDWGGFNVDSAYIFACKKVPVPDYNVYDQVMDEIVSRIVAHVGSTSPTWSLIGTSLKQESYVLKHEIAHALWDTKRAYRREARALVDALPADVRERCYEELRGMGYTSHGYATEIAAYAATGLTALKDTGLRKYAAPFRKLYRSYAKGITIKTI